MVQTSAALESSTLSRQGLMIFWLSIACTLLIASQAASVSPDWRGQDNPYHSFNGMGPACLFVGYSELRRPSGSANVIANSQSFVSDSCLDQLNERIIGGMVKRVRQTRFGYSDISVDLQVVVDDSIDRGLANADPYWRYYTDCDCWEVAFNDGPPSSSPDLTGLLKHACRQLLQNVEFMLVENRRPRPCHIDVQTPVVATANCLEIVVNHWTLTQLAKSIPWHQLVGYRLDQLRRINQWESFCRTIYDTGHQEASLPLDADSMDVQ